MAKSATFEECVGLPRRKWEEKGAEGEEEDEEEEEEEAAVEEEGGILFT